MRKELRKEIKKKGKTEENKGEEGIRERNKEERRN